MAIELSRGSKVKRLWALARFTFAPSISPLVVGFTNFLLIYIAAAGEFNLSVYKVTSVTVFLALSDQMADFGRRLQILKKSNQFNPDFSSYQLVSFLGAAALYWPFNYVVPESMTVEAGLVICAALSPNVSLPFITLRRHLCFYLDALAITAARVFLFVLISFGVDVVIAFGLAYVVGYFIAVIMVNLAGVGYVVRSETGGRQASLLSNISAPNYISQGISVMANRAPLIVGAYFLSDQNYAGLAVIYSGMGLASILYLATVGRMYTVDALTSVARGTMAQATLVFYAFIYVALAFVVGPIFAVAGYLPVEVRDYQHAELGLVCLACAAQSMNHFLRFLATSGCEEGLMRDTAMCVITIALIGGAVTLGVYLLDAFNPPGDTITFLWLWLASELALVLVRWPNREVRQ